MDSMIEEKEKLIIKIENEMKKKGNERRFEA